MSKSPIKFEDRSRKLMCLVFLLFFLISLMTNIMGPLIPEITSSFRLSLAAAGLFPFAFLLSYSIVSIPAGILAERISARSVLLGALLLTVAGALLFSSNPVYSTALVSFFLIGTGVAALQVIINPLLRVAGGEEHYAFNSTLAQFIFGAGAFLAPLLSSYLISRAGQPQRAGWLRVFGPLTPEKLPWVSAWWMFALAGLALMGISAAFRIPRIAEVHDGGARSWPKYLLLLKTPIVWLYFAGVFLYVGLEQGLAKWMSQFLLAYHNVDPRTTGVMATSWFWGAMTLGCLAGMLLLKLFDSRKVLIGASVGALATFTAAVAGPGSVSLLAFPATGLFLSVMWPITFSLGLNSLSHSHGVFAGILCSAIVGGAVLPAAIGQLGEFFGLRIGMLVLYIAMGWILAIGFWAKPLIRNATIR